MNLYKWRILSWSFGEITISGIVKCFVHIHFLVLNANIKVIFNNHFNEAKYFNINMKLYIAKRYYRLQKKDA